MPKLPRISAAEAQKALQRLGFVVVRQRGSHEVGTLAGIVKQAGVSVETFIQAL
jgi:predicted RNA binding protein YcfA (HicA-like mRNA interferase family)